LDGTNVLKSFIEIYDLNNVKWKLFVLLNDILVIVLFILYYRIHWFNLVKSMSKSL